MTLSQDLHKLANEASPAIPGLEKVESRAKLLARRRRAMNAVLLAVVVVGGGLAAPKVWNVLENDGSQDGGSIVAPAAGPTPMASDAPTCPPSFDSCGEDQALLEAEGWLGSILDGAGIEYENAYRADGGGFHHSKEWDFSISVLRPIQESPELQATKLEMHPVWSVGEIVVYGTQYEAEGSSGAYFFWRAGGVDTHAQKHWFDSGSPQPDELRPVIGTIIREQERNPYSFGEDG